MQSIPQPHCQFSVTGKQSKSAAIHVDDVVAAMLRVARRIGQASKCSDVGTDDYITVTEIADLVVGELGLEGVEYRFSGGARGWQATCRSSASTAARSGHSPTHSRTSREALLESIWANRLEATEELESVIEVERGTSPIPISSVQEALPIRWFRA